jgi:hypothetical protein
VSELLRPFYVDDRRVFLARIEKLEARAASLVPAGWPMVEALARAVLGQGTLSGAEVARILKK